MAVAVSGWWIWAYATFVIGTRLLPTAETEADPGLLRRTIGFSAAPGILRFVMVFPLLAVPAFVVGTLWGLVAMVVAVRQALDYDSTGRALAVCLIGVPLYAIPLLVSVLFLGPWPVSPPRERGRSSRRPIVTASEPSWLAM
jgi:hypothetical protein